MALTLINLINISRAADLLDEVLREHDNRHRRPSLPDHLVHGGLASSQSSSSFSFTDDEPVVPRSNEIPGGDRLDAPAKN